MSEHYFSATAPKAGEVTTMPVRLAGRDVQVFTAPKVFSQARLDLGTSVLLRAVPAPPPTGSFLDLGCGWGPIALTLGLLSPNAEVLAVDVNDRALDLTRRNAAALGLTKLRASRPEQVDGGERFDLIWSNPAIRIGKAEVHAMLELWLGRLTPNGQAYLVVHKHLGADSLTTWLNTVEGLHARKHASAKGFRVIEVTRG